MNRGESLTKIDELRHTPDPTCDDTHHHPSLDTPLFISSHWDPSNSADHAFITLFCEECGEQLKVPIWCGDRFCLFCAGRRADKYRDFVWKRMRGNQKRYAFRMITLTVKSTSSIADGYEKLRILDRKLRRNAIWVNSVKGGAYSIEVTKTEHGWHVHAHYIVEGSYIAQKALSGAVGRITGGESYIVDVRLITNSHRGIREAIKYPFKPTNAKHWSDADKDEFRSFMRNRRNFVTFGSWYNADPEEKKDTECPFCGAINSFYCLEYLEKAYDADFEYIVKRIRDGKVNPAVKSTTPMSGCSFQKVII